MVLHNRSPALPKLECFTKVIQFFPLCEWQFEFLIPLPMVTTMFCVLPDGATQGSTPSHFIVDNCERMLLERDREVELVQHSGKLLQLIFAIR